MGSRVDDSTRRRATDTVPRAQVQGGMHRARISLCPLLMATVGTPTQRSDGRHERSGGYASDHAEGVADFAPWLYSFCT